MYNLQDNFVDAYKNDAFWMGMTSSQSSESINTYFDNILMQKLNSDFVR